MATITKITLPNESVYDLRASSIPYGNVDATSTATAFTATVPGITALTDGVCVFLRNGYVTSAANFTLNVNGLGGKPCYNNMATGNNTTPTAPTRDTTIFNIAYTMLFVYSENIVEGGGWICYRGYDANTNTIGYQLRTNSATLPASDKFYRYRILFTSADGSKWVPSTTSTSTNATAARAVNQRPINPYGPIVYYGTTTAVEANANVAAAQLWQQYTLTFGYAFNRTGAALVLSYPAPIYIKCAPQSDGSAIIDADTPYVQALPSTADGKIYIFLGIAYSATAVEVRMEHPVYYYADGAIRLWTNAAAGGSSVDPATATPLADGTAAVGTSVKYAREDHVHPTDTSRQAVLVSGTNIKTVNNESLLGSGNITIQGGGTALTTQEVEDAVDAAFVSTGYSITRIDPNNYMLTINTDGVEDSSGGFITQADAEEEVTVAVNHPFADIIVTRDDTSENIWPDGGGGVFWFEMPGADITIEAFLAD